jgi:hypothetical protein
MGHCNNGCGSGCGCSPTPYVVNSNNISHVNHNYHARPVHYGQNHCGCNNTPHIVSSHYSCQHPHTQCLCDVSCGCGEGGGGNSTTGNVPAGAVAAPYLLANQLSPGTYMISAADNVAGGEIFVGPTQIAKTIGTQFTITLPTDVFFTVNTVSPLASSIRFTKI